MNPDAINKYHSYGGRYGAVGILNLTAQYDSHGKLRFDDIEYWKMPDKSVLSSLSKEGWELVRIVPITVKIVKEIKSNE